MANCIFCGLDRGNNQDIPCACGSYNIDNNIFGKQYSEEEKLKISILLRQLSIDKFLIRIMPKNRLLNQYDIQWFREHGELVSNERTIAIDEIAKAPSCLLVKDLIKH